MRRQQIHDPVEHLDFHVNLHSACSAIAADVCSGSYIPDPPARFLAEKTKGLCRQLVIPSVKDALILQTLSDALWAELKRKAPSENAFYAPDEHKFSQIIRGHLSEYGPINAWLLFQERIFGFTKSRKFIVVTDIANYYDCISYDHLRNILADLAITREHSLDLLIFALTHMLWQPDYMPRVHVGLPQMNLDAPRLLAHCFLFEIDRLHVQDRNVEFARYMDDIDIGVDTIAKAKMVLRDLDLSLHTRQIRLNSGKTQILSHEQARVHFRIRENAFLSRLEDSIDSKLALGVPIDRERRFLTAAIRFGLQFKRFEGGNGDKILKRLINYARKFSAEIDDHDFTALLLKWPSVRAPSLLWWEHSSAPERKLSLVCSFVQSKEIIDDAALINMATSIVEARLPADQSTRETIEAIIAGLDTTTKWGLYAALWILSKYGSESELMRLVESSTSIWTTDECLSRLVAGLHPIMNGSTHFGKFCALLSRSNNRWCQSIIDFHQGLASTTKGYTAIRGFIQARNPSLPNQISHSKFLMLLSLAKNLSIAPTAIRTLREKHAFALEDSHYKARIERHIFPPALLPSNVSVTP